MSNAKVQGIEIGIRHQAILIAPAIILAFTTFLMGSHFEVYWGMFGLFVGVCLVIKMTHPQREKLNKKEVIASLAVFSTIPIGFELGLEAWSFIFAITFFYLARFYFKKSATITSGGEK